MAYKPVPAYPSNSENVLIQKTNNNLVYLFDLMSGGLWKGNLVGLGDCLCSNNQVLVALNNNVSNFYTWWQDNGGGSGGTPGNPTALVGLTAVNGTATTYMRSDAAPALDQSIAPTWTGAHTFSSNNITISTSGKGVSLNGGGTITGASGAITLTTAGTNQPITLNTAGTNAVILPITSAGGIQLYNTADNTTNYERLEMLWSSNVALLRVTQAGSGVLRTLKLSSGAASFAIDPVGATGFTAAAGASSAPGVNTTGFLITKGTDSATSGTKVGLSIATSYNQASGTAANTDLLIKRTETALGSGAQLFFDCQINGSSKLSFSNTGLITTASTTLIATSVSLSNGAGASTGTLTNAPSVGNPTKWIPINDNGTTRYVPSW